MPGAWAPFAASGYAAFEYIGSQAAADANAALARNTKYYIVWCTLHPLQAAVVMQLVSSSHV